MNINGKDEKYIVIRTNEDGSRVMKKYKGEKIYKKKDQ